MRKDHHGDLVVTNERDLMLHQNRLWRWSKRIAASATPAYALLKNGTKKTKITGIVKVGDSFDMDIYAGHTASADGTKMLAFPPGPYLAGATRAQEFAAYYAPTPGSGSELGTLVYEDMYDADSPDSKVGLTGTIDAILEPNTDVLIKLTVDASADVTWIIEAYEYEVGE